jgi:hypothetical protein
MATIRRTRMPMAVKLAPAVVVAGTLLGWMLGSAADPVMKQGIEPARHAVPASLPALLPDQGWPDLAPGTLHPSGDYGSDLDYGAAVGSEWISPDIQPEPYLAPPAPLGDALEAAGEAERAADEAARAIATPSPAKPEAEPGSRKSVLGQSGLY